MERLSKQSTITVRNSPIEFIVTGLKGEYNSVLVRTESAGLDLIGSRSLVSSQEPKTEWFPYSLTSIFGGDDELRISSVDSYIMSRSDSDRGGHLTFSWKGMSSSRDQRLVHDEFNRSAADLQIALDSGDQDRVEWAISPVVYLCGRLTKKHRLSRNRVRLLFLAVLLLYAVIFVIYLGKIF